MDLTSSKSQSHSFCDVIEAQHKSQRTPINKESEVFPFQNFCTKNFSAAKELERIDQISQEVNDNETPWFSLEYESFPVKRSSYQFIAEPVHLPVQLIEQQKKIAPKEKTTTQMALNEYKYSKGNNFYKKVPPPVTSLPSKTKPTADLLSQLRQSTKNPMSTQQIYNFLEDMPMTPAENVNRPSSILSNSSFNFDSQNNDWFETSRQSQREPSAALFSQLGYASSPLREEFVPSQSRFNWI